MKNLKLTLLAWLLILVSVIYASSWWFSLTAPWRISSLAAVFVASFLLILNHSLKNFGNFFRSDVASSVGPFTGDSNLVDEVTRWHSNFKKRLFLFLFLILSYLVVTLMVCPVFKEVSQLYLYIVGWAVICLLVNEQIRTYLLVSALMNELGHDIELSPGDTKRAAS